MDMGENHPKSILTNREVLEFLNHAAIYCAMIEAEGKEWDKTELQHCREALAGVYLYACRLPELQIDPFLSLERMVEESMYEGIRERLEGYFGEYDRFLNAQMEGMKYSEAPINVSTSELLADIYQVLADTLWIFRHQIERNMVQDRRRSNMGLSMSGVVCFWL